MNETEKSNLTPKSDKSFSKPQFNSTMLHNVSSGQRGGEARVGSSNDTPGNSIPFVSRKCAYCSADHLVYVCTSFAALSVNERVQYVKTHRLCFKCLKANHSAQECRGNVTCATCRGNHHTLLHFAETSTTSISHVSDSITGDNLDTTNCCSVTHCSPYVVLSTVIIRVPLKGGGFKHLRALIDTGSEFSYIRTVAVDDIETTSVADQTLNVTGFGEHSDGPKIYQHYTFMAHGLCKSIELHALATDKLCASLPHTPIGNWPHLQNILPLISDRGHENFPRSVDIIIGCQQLGIVLTGDIKTGNPMAWNTVFGWLYLGILVLTTVSITHTIPTCY